MNIRRTRTRTLGTMVVPDYSDLASAPLLKTAPCGQSLTLCVHEGILTSAYKTVVQELCDTLDEGFKVFEIAHAALRTSFSQLRRVGTWPRKLPLVAKEMAVSTSNLSKFRLTYPGTSGVNTAMLARGYWTDYFGDYWIKIIADPDRPMDELYAEALLECDEVNVLYAGLETSVERIPYHATVCWAFQGSTVPAPSMLPTTPDFPPEFLVGSGELLEARYGAWESLQRGGSSIKELNRLQAVLECKDVPQTFQQVFDFAEFVANYSKKNGWNQGGASLLTMASAYLWWKFGVKPTLDDANKWLSENIRQKAVMLVEPAEKLLRVGATVRCAYQVREDLAEKNTVPAVKRWDSTTNHSFTTNGVQTVYDYDPLADLQLPAACDPIEGVIDRWEHRGVMFSRAMKPGDEMMPDWVWELYPQSGPGEVLQPFTKTRRALVINPPVSTIWELTGYSFLVDWVATVGKTIERLERLLTGTNILVGFGKLWACDRWTVRPRWPKPVYHMHTEVIVDTNPDIEVSEYVPTYHTEPTGWWIKVPRKGVCKFTATTSNRLETRIAFPHGGAVRHLVIRDEIAKPHIPPVKFKVRLGASKLLILGALSIPRIKRLGSLFESLRKSETTAIMKLLRRRLSNL